MPAFQNYMILFTEQMLSLNNILDSELFFTSNITDAEVEARFKNLLPGIRTVFSAELSLLGSTLCKEGFNWQSKKYLKV